MENGSLPKAAERQDGFSSYIALIKASKAFEVRQPKHHRLSEFFLGKKKN